jgi:hypothetical protein
MALSKLVTEKEVKLQIPDLWNIILNLTCTDASVEVINQDFSVKYRTGNDIEDKTAQLQEEMQAAIDKYNAEQVIKNHPKMDALVTTLNANLTG